MKAIVQSHIAEELQKKPQEQMAQTPEKDKPLEEQIAAIVENMGQLNEDFHFKFDALRSIMPDDLLTPLEESEVKPFMDALWNIIEGKNGCVIYRRKAVALSRKDLAEYERLLRFFVHKVELKRQQEKEQKQQDASSIDTRREEARALTLEDQQPLADHLPSSD